MNTGPITIEMVCAMRERQVVRELSLPTGATVAEALTSAESLMGPDAMAGIDRSNVGVWGRVVTPETILRNGDRLEFLRGLTADPKEARRRREAVRRRKV